ncbi:hypothetical protein KEM60_01347 [Austwickia sp. TVS 96-490-7B]|uniref:hypothetical protein n=1 Tax=Austwickia sp. TVS 96-490-7B TaxID=2830843 RepID=UPI001C5821D7|nr:hypothetical protein [Austwickia sp. TVS 96-490-7B]MBW3085150.1 hypothetical protein [Austwickia sp. TVS 96-490-7B]
MGLGLLLLTAGAFLRFVLGRYAGMIGAYDVPGTVLMSVGVACMVAVTVRHVMGRRIHLVPTAVTGPGPDAAAAVDPAAAANPTTAAVAGGRDDGRS